MGILTQFLYNKNINLKVIEIDKSYFLFEIKLSKIKHNRWGFSRNDLEEVTRDKFSLIGNFPYNISSQILFKIFENRDKITEVVGMFQKELKELFLFKVEKKEF